MVYDIFAESLDSSTGPCNDFFTYACSGWLKKITEKYNGPGKVVRPGVSSTLSEAIRIVLLAQFGRLSAKDANFSLSKIRQSELQPVQFFESSRRTLGRNSSGQILETMRNFFRDIKNSISSTRSETTETLLSGS